jgi:cysteinyl-tRNA synthetase
MDDDFNTPRAIAALFELSREVNAWLHSGQPVGRATLEAIEDAYGALGGEVLGLRLGELSSSDADRDSDLLDGLVRLLIDIRREARQARDWARSDAIRDQLAELGIALEDGPEGTRWRKSR